MASFASIEDLIDHIQARLLKLNGQSQPHYQAADSDKVFFSIKQLNDEYQRLIRSEEQSNGSIAELEPSQGSDLDELESELHKERSRGISLRSEIRFLIDMILEFVEI